jgi:tetratricopeptide (TPR) repeat protein
MAAAGDLTRAEQYIGAAMVRGYPENQALPVLIRVCIAASRLRVAVGYAEPYLDRNPRDWSLRLVVASLYLGLGEPVKARRHLELVMAAHPEEAETYYLMGLLMRDEVGDPTAAERHFARYLRLEPDGPHHEEAEHALSTIRIVVERPEGATRQDNGSEALDDQGGHVDDAEEDDGGAARARPELIQ